MKVRFSRRNSDLLLAIILFAVGVIYLLLMLPLFYITPIFGVGNSSWPPNGFLSTFEIFWQPICAILYFLAAWKIFRRKDERTQIFANLPLFASLIEALVLNVYQIIATRVSQKFVDGIFTSNAHYSMISAFVYIALPIVTIAFVNHYFVNSSRDNVALHSK